MKHLFILRHLNGDEDGLYPHLVEQFKKLLIKTFASNSLVGKTVIISSPLERATDTARILGDFLSIGKDIVKSNTLTQEDNPSIDHYESIYKIIAEHMSADTDTLIIVTHGEYTGGLLLYTLDRINGKPLVTEYSYGSGIQKGQMIMYNFEKNEGVVVGPKDTDGQYPI